MALVLLAIYKGWQSFRVPVLFHHPEMELKLQTVPLRLTTQMSLQHFLESQSIKNGIKM